ncbi:hypothetical protein GCM10025868_12880 [Angustibacter aerolatus]|uniref:catalase n=1 Tax=Angustibacter aerolatus TaxID=1162965 RepID=A0ABQ6JCZ3_9ACTN|nr:hypothetical protein GCM10025868_12880 [Angustibacter aerolatus]
MAGGRDSSEAARDPRGFAIKMYTEEGNWDLVGNNLGVFFIRDAIKFPDFIHSQKPDPVTFDRQVPNRVFDFISQTPEAMHMVTLVFGPRGLPAAYRFMQGFGVNTYKWVNAQGETQAVKYHWLPKQGVRSWTAADAAVVQGQEPRRAHQGPVRRDRRGRLPQWEPARAGSWTTTSTPRLDFDPLDDTKVWPENLFPLRKVGTMTLDRRPENFFTENEQIAFGTGVLVDGLDFSDDKMLVGRTFAYSDTQRYRVGPNYLQPAGELGQGCEGRHQPARRADGVRRRPGPRPEPLGELRAVDPRRPARGRVPDARRAGPRDHRAPDPQADPAHERLRAGRRAVPALGAVGARRPGRQPDRCARPVRPPDPGAHGLAPAHVRGRAWASASATASASAPTTCGTSSRSPPRRSASPSLQRLANLGKNGPRDVEGLVMTHCVPNEHVTVEA